MREGARKLRRPSQVQRDSRLSVCFVAEHPSSGVLGGAEVAMSILADKLAEEGVDVHYASTKCPERGPESIKFHRVLGWSARAVQKAANQYGAMRKISRDMPASSIRQVDLKTPESSIAGMSSKARSFLHGIYARGYATSLSHVDADVYLQVCAGRPTGYVANFCKGKGKPFVFRSTCLWDADLTFTWGWTSWRDYTKHVYLEGVKQADVIAANSKNTASAFMKHLGEDRVRFLPDGFHIPPCPDFSRRDGYVLWVGRDASYKRAWLYAELATMLPRHLFVMVGDIQSLSNLPPNLQLLGAKSPSELSRIYSGAKVLVNTSEVEGFPNVLIEAGMHGVPYVGFLDPDGVVGEYSLGLCAKDLSDMAKKVEILMETEDLRLRLGKNARRFVEEQRDIENVVERWLLLFDEITSRKP